MSRANSRFRRFLFAGMALLLAVTFILLLVPVLQPHQAIVTFRDGSRITIRGITVGTNHQIYFSPEERFKRWVPKTSILSKLLSPTVLHSCQYSGTVVWATWQLSSKASSTPQFLLIDGTNGPVHLLFSLYPQGNFVNEAGGAVALGAVLPNSDKICIGILEKRDSGDQADPAGTFWMPNPTPGAGWALTPRVPNEHEIEDALKRILIPRNEGSLPLDAEGVIKRADTNALPLLLRLASQTNDEPRGVYIIAGAGFQVLRERAAPAVSTLIKNLDDPNPTIREVAIDCLGKIGPAAREAIPKILAALQDPSRDIRRSAAMSIMFIPADPAIVVPAIIKFLEAPHAEDGWGVMEQTFTMAALRGHYLAQAAPALPVLRKMTNNPRSELSLEASSLITLIEHPPKSRPYPRLDGWMYR
jgi:hypothetical protein